MVYLSNVSGLVDNKNRKNPPKILTFHSYIDVSLKRSLSLLNRAVVYNVFYLAVKHLQNQ